MEEPKIAKGSLPLEDRGGALLGALVMVLDSKGSVDVAVGVNPEPKGSEDELKGSAPPSFTNGPEAGVDALDADDLNPAKGSARLAVAKGSELGKASVSVEKEEEALEDEVNEPNTSWSVEALEPLDVADGGALGLGRGNEEDGVDSVSTLGLGRRMPMLLLPLWPALNPDPPSSIGSFLLLGTLILIFSPAFKLRSLIGDDKAAVTPAAAWSSLSHSALCSCNATLKSNASFLSLNAKPMYACLPKGLTILRMKYLPESTVLSTLPSVTGDAAKTALFSSMRKMDASRPFATIFSFPVHM